MRAMLVILVVHLFACAAFPGPQNLNGDLEKSELDSLRGSLIRLPWAEKEVQEIANLVAGKAFLRGAATEKSFKENAPEAGIIHLATHAIVDDQRPLYSKFVFAPNEDSGEDGYLNTYELYNMDLKADLAVLSACNTGYGKLHRGEGIMSLARGFIYAGCPSIVMSLWPVDDRASALLMTDFYKGLSEGRSKDAALRAAKLEYLKTADAERANPFYWAGFVSIGDTRPLALAPRRNYTPWIAVSVVLLALVAVGLGTRIVRSRSQFA